MTTRDPDSSAAVMIALFAATMLACLIGAFVLPPSGAGYKVPGIILAALVLALPWLNRAAHRSRIRRAVSEMGGVVVRIRCLPFWQQFWQVQPYLRLTGVRHEVDYVDATGLLHHALCYSSWFIGVEWLDDVVEDSH